MKSVHGIPASLAAAPDDSFPNLKSFTAATNLSSVPNSFGGIFNAGKMIAMLTCEGETPHQYECNYDIGT
jgi:hypothetical protein